MVTETWTIWPATMPTLVIVVPVKAAGRPDPPLGSETIVFAGTLVCDPQLEGAELERVEPDVAQFQNSVPTEVMLPACDAVI